MARLVLFLASDAAVAAARLNPPHAIAMDPHQLGRAFDDLPAARTARSRVLGGFALGVAGAVAAGTLLGRLLHSRSATAAREARLDRAVADTFPASDPPAYAAPAGGTPGGEDER